VPQDYAKAREWHEKAAAAGSAFSMNELGVLYVNGFGVAPDDAKAREWFEKAAAAGNTDGMQHAASLLDAAKGGPADYPRAARLVLQSAKLGHPWSRTVLGGPLTFLTPSTRTELKRELARLGQYNGPIDDVWDDTAHAAVAAYLEAPR
jgi:TPR repeat protein